MVKARQTRCQARPEGDGSGGVCSLNLGFGAKPQATATQTAAPSFGPFPPSFTPPPSLSAFLEGARLEPPLTCTDLDRSGLVMVFLGPDGEPLLHVDGRRIQLLRLHARCLDAC